MKKNLLFLLALISISAYIQAQTQPCFSAPVTYAVGSEAESIATADFNGDGKPDLVVVNRSSENISILLNTGSGTFNAPVNYGGATFHDPTSVTVADFNGDGKIDLAVTDRVAPGGGPVGTVYILLNAGAGIFGAPVSYLADRYPLKVVSADFNADSKPDLAVINENSYDVSILLNSGAGTFGTAVNYKVGSGGTIDPQSITTADFNGDGKADLATSNYITKDVSVLFGTGTGSFGGLTNYGIGSYGIKICSGDFNGDGKPELVVTTGNYVVMLFNSGTGTFSTHQLFSAAQSPISSADFNGDGKLDLVAVNNNNGIYVSLNNTDTFKTTVNYGIGNSGLDICLADFNGDGKIDIATANINGNVSVLLNCPSPIPPSADYSNLPSSVCLGSNVNAVPGVSGTPPKDYYLSNPLISSQVDTAIALCKNKNSVFVLFAGDSVRRYDSAGNYQFTYSYLPFGSHAIAADNNNRLFVVAPDGPNPAVSQIWCYDATGSTDANFWNYGYTPDYTLDYIAGIALGPDGNLYAADTLADIKVISTDNSTQMSSIATPSNLQYSLYKPVDICFGKGGQMYVADVGNHNILARNASNNNFYPVFPKMDANWQVNSVDVDTIHNNIYFTTRNSPNRVVMAQASILFGDTLCTYDTISSYINFTSPCDLAILNQASLPLLWVADNKNPTLNRVVEFTYQIIPALPAGLTFSPFKGGITGTPTSTVGITTYSITVSNPLGTTTNTISFAIDPPGPVSNSAGEHTSSGYQSDGLTIHYFDANNCANMLEIADQVGGGMPGSVAVTQTVTPTISVFNADTFINRVTTILAQDPDDSAHIKIYYSYLDIQHYNQSVGSAVLSNDTVGGTMQIAILQMHESPPGSGHLEPIKHSPVTTTWSNTDHHWVADFAVSKFSTFYAGDTARIGAFSCINGHADTIVTNNNYYLWHGDTLYYSGDYTDVLTNKKQCDSVCTINLTINQTIGIATALLDKSVLVYPNPSSGLLNIDISNPNVVVNNIRITNLIGEEVYNANGNNNTGKIDVSGLPSGVYIISITSQQETTTRKILKE